MPQPSISFRKFAHGYAADGDYVVALAEFTSDRLQTPLRLSSSHEQISSQGRVYLGVGLDYRLPGQHDEQQSYAQLALAGISPQLLKLMDDHPESFDVRLEIVLRRTPDVIEGGPFFLKSQSFTMDYDSGAGAMDCAFSDVLDLPLVTTRYTRINVPGAYGASE